MLPLLLLLLPAARGIGESGHATGTGSGFPPALRGSPERRHQDPLSLEGQGSRCHRHSGFCSGCRLWSLVSLIAGDWHSVGSSGGSHWRAPGAPESGGAGQQMPPPFWVPPQVSLVSPPLVPWESCTGVPPWHGVSLYLLMKPGFEASLGVGGEQRPHCRDPGVQLSLSPPRAGAAGGIRTLHRPLGFSPQPSWTTGPP